jgi:hypothetical protein
VFVQLHGSVFWMKTSESFELENTLTELKFTSCSVVLVIEEFEIEMTNAAIANPRAVQPGHAPNRHVHRRFSSS